MDNGLGNGSVKKKLLHMAVPAVMAQLVNLLYNIVDRIYIGHLPGVGGAALTGAGLFAPILMLITAFAYLSGAGGAPRAAITMGRGDTDCAEKILANCFSMLLWLSLLITVSMYWAAPGLLRFFGASDDTMPYALMYSRIYVLGTVFVLIVMGMNSFITCQGFAKISMMTTLIGAVLNIILDPIFMFVFNWGVAGAAIATVISQAVSAAWILCFLCGKKTLLKLRLSNMKLERRILLPCLALGISSFVMLSTESILSVSFTASLSKYGGDLAVGAMTVFTAINQLFTMPIIGICQAAQPLIGFNYGAKKFDRVKEAFFTQFFSCIIYTFILWAFIMLFPGSFASIFTNDTALADYTAKTLRVFLLFGFTVGFQSCCQQSFIALGQAKISLVMALLRKVFLLIPLIFILPLFFENKVFAVFLAEPVSDIIAAAITTSTFFIVFKKLLKQ